MTKQAYTVAQALIDLGIVNVAADLATAKDDDIKAFVTSQRDKLVKDNETDNEALSKIKAAMSRCMGKHWGETINAVKTLAATTLAAQEEQKLRNAVFKEHGNKAREAWDQGNKFSGIGDALAIIALSEAIEQVGTLVAHVETKEGSTPVAFDIAEAVNEPLGNDGKVLRSVQEARINALLIDVFGYTLPGDDAEQRKEWNRVRSAAKSRIARTLPIAVLVTRKAKELNTEVARIVTIDDAGVFRVRGDLVRKAPAEDAKELEKVTFTALANAMIPIDGKGGHSITEMGNRARDAKIGVKDKPKREPHKNDMGADPKGSSDFKVAFTIICGRVRNVNRSQPGYKFTDEEVNELRTLERELVQLLNKIDERKAEERKAQGPKADQKQAATA